MTPSKSAASEPATPTLSPRVEPPVRPAYQYSLRRLNGADRRSMTGVSWRSGCPVGLGDLRVLTVRYNTYSGSTRIGRLIVNRDVATDVGHAFGAMYRHRFPIRRMEPVDRYGGSDRRSISANNTSAFNCRVVPHSTVWSQHALGRAVDINPVQNPYWRPDGYVEPARGRKYLDRSVEHEGMIHEGDAVTRAFDRLGWGWGGRWTSLKDWQHFSIDGR